MFVCFKHRFFTALVVSFSQPFLCCSVTTLRGQLTSLSVGERFSLPVSYPNIGSSPIPGTLVTTKLPPGTEGTGVGPVGGVAVIGVHTGMVQQAGSEGSGFMVQRLVSIP